MLGNKSSIARVKIYDYIIIGAGPAGCFCAARLSEAGKSVLILEKNTIFYGKVCGDGISMKCVDMLRKLGFPSERFEQAGATCIHKRIIIRNGESKVTHFGLDDGTVSYGIPRNKTDLIFRTYATEKGVKIVYETEVNEINKKGRFFCVEGYIARRIVVACGAFGRLKILGKQLVYHTKEMAIGISATVSCKCDVEPCFLFDYDDKYKGQYAWIFKTDSNNWNVGLWLRNDRENIKVYFNDFLENKLPKYFGQNYLIQCPPKGAIMAVRKSGVKRNPILKPVFRRVYYIGDVNMTSDELEGEGIRQAIISGLILSDKLIKSRMMRTLIKRGNYENN